MTGKHFHVLLFPLLQESYPSTPPIWFVDSDDPSLAEVLERLEDVRKGSTLVSWLMWLQFDRGLHKIVVTYTHWCLYQVHCLHLCAKVGAPLEKENVARAQSHNIGTTPFFLAVITAWKHFVTGSSSFKCPLINFLTHSCCRPFRGLRYF